ncbi:MAG: cytochrome c [Planctomycetota bacterium]
MRTPSGRRNLIAVLVCCFFAQTALVYLDDSGRQTPPLSKTAQVGWEVWHRHNCQSCHQIHGFGGFFGPDLTNAAEYLAYERLQSILTDGAGRMPAFHLSSDEIAGIAAFLAALNETGTGQLRLARTPSAIETLDAVVAAAPNPLNPLERTGHAVVQARKCIGCHLPNKTATVVGPDMRHLLERLGEKGVLGTVAAGRGPKGMPAFDLSENEERGMLAFLAWLRENCEALGLAFEDAAGTAEDGAGIPWFEYRR